MAIGSAVSANTRDSRSRMTWKACCSGVGLGAAMGSGARVVLLRDELDELGFRELTRFVLTRLHRALRRGACRGGEGRGSGLLRGDEPRGGELGGEVLGEGADGRVVEQEGGCE